jgi:hypothetical protein
LLSGLALEPATDDAFRGAIGLGASRDGIHFRGVEEVDSGCQREIELGVGIGLAGLFAEGHGAEADFGDFQGAAAKGIDQEWGHWNIPNSGKNQG